MNIGVIGRGKMGGNLGKLWAGKGHRVLFGSREPQKAKTMASTIAPNASGGTYTEAAQFGEAVLLAVPWRAAQDAIKAAGNLVGKVLIDCTNPGLTGLLAGQTSSAEEIAKWATGARVVKAFNYIGYENLSNPQFGSQQASAFICGDDEAAKSVVTRLAEDIGFDVVDAGPLPNAQLLESLAMLWVQLARKQGRNIAFKLLRR